MKQYQFNYELLSEWLDPEAVFNALYADHEKAFWLDSSNVVEGFSRFSYMGAVTKGIRYSLSDKSEDIFFRLEKRLKEIQIAMTSLPFDFVGGYVGYFGYELKQLCGFSNLHTSAYPDATWFFVDRFFIFDHKEKRVYLGCLSEDKKDAEDWFGSIKKELLMIKEISKMRKTITASLRLEVAEKEYLAAINACKTYLHEGESYEICLTNRLRGSLDEDPLAVYNTLRTVNPAPYAAYFRDGDLAILSSSPERFLKIDQERWVDAKPMKGTIARSSDLKEDDALAKKLQQSEKDRAENLMIVDLLRNDLGKVCEIGSVSVPELMKVETYQTVHQMISTIRGKLRSDISAIDCIKACFPGGSMTGAPKKRTIEILDSLEKSARGVYSGALGFLSANGSADLNIVIRTIVLQNDDVSIGTGGAITYQSDPQKEYEEMLLKTQALQKAFSEW